jgi:hypothetical protein
MRGAGRGERLEAAPRRRRLGNAGAAEDDDRVGDIVLAEQRLRLLVVEQQPRAAHVVAGEEIGIAIGLAIARAVDDRADLGRRRRVLGGRLGPPLRQRLMALAARRRRFHGGQRNESI